MRRSHRGRRSRWRRGTLWRIPGPRGAVRSSNSTGTSRRRSGRNSGAAAPMSDSSGNPESVTGQPRQSPTASHDASEEANPPATPLSCRSRRAIAQGQLKSTACPEEPIKSATSPFFICCSRGFPAGFELPARGGEILRLRTLETQRPHKSTRRPTICLVLGQRWGGQKWEGAIRGVQSCQTFSDRETPQETRENLLDSPEWPGILYPTR